MSSGIGSEIVSIISSKAFNYLDGPPERISSLDIPLPYAKNLEDISIPNSENVAKQCLNYLENS